MTTSKYVLIKESELLGPWMLNRAITSSPRAVKVRDSLLGIPTTATRLVVEFDPAECRAFDNFEWLSREQVLEKILPDEE